MSETYTLVATPTAAADHTATPVTRRRWPFWACVLLAMVLMFANYIFAMPVSLLIAKLGIFGSGAAGEEANHLVTSPVSGRNVCMAGGVSGS